MTDQQHDHAPMHGGSGASDKNEPGNSAPLGPGEGFHLGAEHSGGAGSICICVDDFGLHPGVNEAVMRLADLGRVQATGCMTGAPAWGPGASALRRLGGIDVGLHLDFTEHPLQAEARRGLGSVILLSYLSGLDRGLLRREIVAQLDAFEAAMGRPPAFVDGHQHVHQLPRIREELLAEMDTRYGGLARRPWIRSTRSPDHSFKAGVIEFLGARQLAALARRSGYAQNGRLLGVYDFSGGPERYEELLAGWIAAAEPGDLLMCHPSTGDATDPLDAARRAEFEVLSRPDFVGQLLRQAGLTLGRIRRS